MAKKSLQTTQKAVANCDHLPQLSVESRIFGASLKDLGKKWFAFSLMQDLTPQDLISRIYSLQ